MRRSFPELLVLFILILSSCSISGIRKEVFTLPENTTSMAVQELPNLPPIEKIRLPEAAFVLSSPPFPDLKTEIHAEFYNASLSDILFSISRAAGAKIVFSPDAVTRKVLTLSFSGTLSDFLKSLSEITGCFFSESGGVITLKEKETFCFHIPGYPGIKEAVIRAVEGMGGEDVKYDPVSSSVIFTSDYRSFRTIRNFLMRLRKNAALIVMRVVVLSVSFRDEKSAGVDWTRIMAGYRAQRMNDAFGLRAEESEVKTGFGFSGEETGASVFIENRNFTLSGFLNFIERYGKYSILQNVVVETFSGGEGTLKVTSEIPYVKKIGIAALSAQASSYQQTVETDKVESGITITIKPCYSSREKSIYMSLDVDISSVVRLVNLTAGSQSFTQPEVARKKIRTDLRLKPGQVAVTGGLIYRKREAELSGLPPDTFLTKAGTRRGEREEIVIIVRPRVIEFVS